MIVRSSLVGLLATSLVGLVVANGGCSLVVERDLKSGIGAACQSNDQCQGEGTECSTDGVCTKGCTTDTDCPTGAVCSPASNKCFEKLKIGAIYIGNSGEGWTKTHADGLAEVATALGFPEIVTTEGVVPGPQDKGAQKVVEGYIAAGAKVIVATSTSYATDISPIAAQHPDVKFLVCEGTTVTQNLGSYYGRREQAWYIAGQVAAKAAPEGKLGVVGSFISPDNVRNINAYLLGARTINPDAKVEVRWSGFWFDYNDRATYSDDNADGSNFCTQSAPCYLEEYLTDKLIAGGAEVVTHQTDVDRSVNFVERYNLNKTPEATRTVYSVANNNRYGCRASGQPTGSVLPSCLSAVYWNWTPIYTTLFSEMRVNKWVPQDIYESIKSDARTSIVGVEQSELGNNMLGQFELNNAINAIATNADPYWIFSGARGGYNAIKRPAGDRVEGPLSKEEVLKMCWFADGVVEHRDERCAENPTLEGCAAVPAEVPMNGRVPWKALPPFGETTTAFDCAAHGGT